MIWFWNKSANETDLKLEEKNSRNIDGKYLEKEQSKIEQVINFKIS